MSRPKSAATEDYLKGHEAELKLSAAGCGESPILKE
jgi:hypothetical protein